MQLKLAIDAYASAIKLYALQKKKITGSRSTGTTHQGLRYLKKKDHRAVAERILQSNWHGRTVARAMFEMAESVEDLLRLENLDWDERKHCGRYLCSCLTMSYLYYLDKDDWDDLRSPWRLYKAAKNKVESEPNKTRFEPFPKWTAPYDRYGNRLLRANRPCPPTKEYKLYVVVSRPAHSTSRCVSKNQARTS